MTGLTLLLLNIVLALPANRDQQHKQSKVLPWLQEYLRLAWRAPDERHRSWYLHEMRRHYRDSTIQWSEVPKIAPGPLSPVPHAGILPEHVHKGLIDPPSITPFEAAAFYFQSRVGDKARYCQHADCSRPYFIAKKPRQRYCSEACGGPANGESKRKWWNENRGKDNQ